MKYVRKKPTIVEAIQCLSEKHLQYAGKSHDGLYCCSGSKGSYGKS